MSQDCYDLTIHFDLIWGVVTQGIPSQTCHLLDETPFSGQISILQRPPVIIHEHVVVMLGFPLLAVTDCDR